MKFIKKTSLGNILLSCTKNPIVMFFFFLFSENTVSEQKKEIEWKPFNPSTGVFCAITPK